MKRYLGAALLLAAAVAACAKKQQAPTVQVAVASYRDIIVDAQANGTIEPLVVTDVKSKAGGVITKMPVETGTHVNPGDLIVQIDTRDVQNKFDQAQAQLVAAQAKLEVAESDKKRNEDMFKARVITPQEYEQVAVNYENAKSGVVSAKANLDLAKQALEEATVRAPDEGTIITKNVAVGTVIASATGSVSGGTTIVQMADLRIVRIRAYFNESDIGNIHPGQPANVTVDAYPDRRFSGSVEKIEPQAVVQQNVTMFPVLVNLQNGEGLLRPGMNGTVAVLIDERDNVLAIPNDAIKTPREAVSTGAMLGLNADTVNAELKAQGYNPGNRGGFGGRNGGGNGANGGRRNGANGAGGGPTGGAGGGTSGGEVALMGTGVAQQSGQGGQGGGFGGGMQVSDDDCKKIDAVLKQHPAEKKQLDDLRAKQRALMPAGFNGANGGSGANGGGRRFGGDSTRRRNGGANAGNGGSFVGGQNSQSSQNGQPGQGGGGNGGRRGSPEMQAIGQQMRDIYTKLSLDARTAGACARRAQGGQAAQNGANFRAQNGGANGAPASAAQGGRGGQLTPPSELSSRPVRPRTGLVFVTDSAKTHFEPRIVQLGQGNLDFTEVLSGLKSGERVVMLGALALQNQRLQQQDRARQNASPLGGQGGPGGGPRGGRG